MMMMMMMTCELSLISKVVLSCCRLSRDCHSPVSGGRKGRWSRNLHNDSTSSPGAVRVYPQLLSWWEPQLRPHSTQSAIGFDMTEFGCRFSLGWYSARVVFSVNAPISSEAVVTDRCDDCSDATCVYHTVMWQWPDPPTDRAETAQHYPLVPSIVLDHVCEFDDEFPLLVLLTWLKCVLIFPSKRCLAALAVDVCDGVQSCQ